MEHYKGWAFLPPRDNDTLEGPWIVEELNWNKNLGEAQKLKKEGLPSYQRIMKKEIKKEKRKKEN
jgi:hypothetical protein